MVKIHSLNRISDFYSQGLLYPNKGNCIYTNYPNINDPSHPVHSLLITTLLVHTLPIPSLRVHTLLISSLPIHTLPISSLSMHTLPIISPLVHFLLLHTLPVHSNTSLQSRLGIKIHS